MASGSEVRSGGAFVEFYAKGDTAIKKTLADIEGRMKKMAGTVAAVSATMAAAGAAITGPMLYGLSVASEATSQLTSGARRTGMSVEQLGGLAYATGGDLDALAGGVRHLNSFMNEAAHGSAEANLRLAELGVTFEELNHMTQDQRFRRVADALNGIGDAAQRGALQTSIFGRSGMSLNLSGGAAGLGAREARGQQLGAVMSAGDVEIVRGYNIAQREMNTAIKALWVEVGTAAAPAMREFFEIITNVVVGAREFINTNRETFSTIFRIADAFVTAAAGGMALAGGLYVAATALQYLGVFAVVGKIALWGYNAAMFVAHAATYGWLLLLAPIAAVTNLVVAGILAGAGYLAYLGAKWVWSTNIIQNAVATIRRVAVAAWDAIVSHFGPVIDFVRDGFNAIVAYVAPTFNIIRDAISSALSSAWDSAKNFFGNMLGTATQAWAGIRSALSTGDFSTIWEILKVSAQLVWHDITEFVKDQWTIWKYTGITVFNAIADLVSDVFDDAITAVRIGWVNFMTDLEKDFGGTFKNIWLAINAAFAGASASSSAAGGRWAQRSSMHSAARWKPFAPCFARWRLSIPLGRRAPPWPRLMR